MEKIVDVVSEARDEAAQSKKELQELANEVIRLSDIVQPQLEKQVHDIRQARMTVVGEIHESLKALKDIRRFFLESDYEFEMARLERFVKLCRELQDLKQNGMLDAMSDVAIRLAVMEHSK